MDAASALADLTEISSQVDAAVVLDADGSVLAATVEDDARAAALAKAGAELLEAGAARIGSAERQLAQLEVALRDGSVFVVRAGGRTIVATTTPAPTSGLVFYDLKTCLSALEGESAKAKRASRRPKDDA